MLIDDGLLVRDADRWAAAGDLTSVPVPPRSTRSWPPASISSAARSGRRSRRRAVEGQVFHEGSVAHLVRGRIRRAARTRCSRPEGARPARVTRLLGRARVPLPAPADQGCGLRVDPEAGPRRCARAPRDVAGDDGEGARTRVRGDPRVPPRAGVPLPAGARSAGRCDAIARPTCRRAARVGRTEGIRPHRRTGRPQPHLPCDRPRPRRRPVAGRPRPQRPGDAGDPRSSWARGDPRERDGRRRAPARERTPPSSRVPTALLRGVGRRPRRAHRRR